MIGNLNPQQIAFFAILIIALVLFVTEWIRTDVVAVLIVIALYVTRVLKVDEALSGFSSEPAIVIAGIFVLSGAMHATGLSDRMGDWIGRFAGKSQPGNRSDHAISGSAVCVHASRHNHRGDASDHVGPFARKKTSGVQTADANVFCGLAGNHDNHYRRAGILDCEHGASTVGEIGPGNFFDCTDRFEPDRRGHVIRFVDWTIPLADAQGRRRSNSSLSPRRLFDRDCRVERFAVCRQDR